MSEQITIEYKSEYELTTEENSQIAQLLATCFPDCYQGKRTYFKQLPHYRFLAKNGQGEIVGQLGIDYRVMCLNDMPIKVWGIVDLCVKTEKQGIGIGGKLLKQAEEKARKHALDFILLLAENMDLYRKHGYQQCKGNHITWLKIDEHKTLGIGVEEIPELMIKVIGRKKWENGVLDMLGYMY